MDILDDIGIPSMAPTPAPYAKKDSSSKINMYDVEVIKAKEIDTDNFDKTGHSFMVHIFAGDDDVTGVEGQILKLVEKLKELGFIYRCDAAQDNKIGNMVANVKDLKKEIYLPFKKFNPNLADSAILSNGYELPFKYAAQLYGQRYNDLSKGARAVYASKVMAGLGENCDNPVDFILCYSPDGREYFGGKDKIDFKKVGTLSYYIKLGQKAGIPIYNLKNSDSLINFVKTHIKTDEFHKTSKLED